MPIGVFMARVYAVIIEPLIILIFGVAFVIFVWIVVVYIRDSHDTKERPKAMRGILWGLAGLAIMVSAFGIVHIIQGTIGVPQTPQQKAIEALFEKTIKGIKVN